MFHLIAWRVKVCQLTAEYPSKHDYVSRRSIQTQCCTYNPQTHTTFKNQRQLIQMTINTALPGEEFPALIENTNKMPEQAITHEYNKVKKVVSHHKTHDWVEKCRWVFRRMFIVLPYDQMLNTNNKFQKTYCWIKMSEKWHLRDFEWDLKETLRVYMLILT